MLGSGLGLEDGSSRPLLLHLVRVRVSASVRVRVRVRGWRQPPTSVSPG